MYDAVNHGVLEVDMLRWALAGLPLPCDRAGRIVLAVDVSAWLRPDAATSQDRAFWYVHGRGRNAAQLIPGWPYSFVAALESGRGSRTAILDAVRVTTVDDLTVLTAAQVRQVVDRLRQACRWCTATPGCWWARSASTRTISRVPESTTSLLAFPKPRGSFGEGEVALTA